MNKPNLTQLARSLRTTIVKHSPGILTGIGIAGMATSTVLAVKATPKALILIEERKDELKGTDVKHPKLEAVKACWKCYIPAVATGALSAVCLISANSVNTRRNAALATAYTLSESALREYQEKVVETIGEKKEQAVKDAIAKDRIDNNPVTERTVIITEKGDTLCYDIASDRYFKSDIEKLKKAVNELNRRMNNETYISLNEFYSEIGLHSTEPGDILGWNTDKGHIDLYFSSRLTNDGTPCLAVGFNNPPVYGYDKLF